jgi:hypothetical protein
VTTRRPSQRRPANRRPGARVAAEMTDTESHMRRIILGLFNPMPDGHQTGCLANDPHIHPRGPCICGYSSVAGEYLWALREAKKIAAAHFTQEAVDKSARLGEPPQLVEAAASAAMNS